MEAKTLIHGTLSRVCLLKNLSLDKDELFSHLQVKVITAGHAPNKGR
jgi:hypothetical protein